MELEKEKERMVWSWTRRRKDVGEVSTVGVEFNGRKRSVRPRSTLGMLG